MTTANSIALALALAKKFPNMAPEAMAQIIEEFKEKPGFTVNNHAFITRAAVAHARHGYTRYNQFLAARKKGVSDIPVFLVKALVNLNKLLTDGILTDDQHYAVWGVICKMVVSEQVDKIMAYWTGESPGFED
jgi:hypothetical protein